MTSPLHPTYCKNSTDIWRINHKVPSYYSSFSFVSVLMGWMTEVLFLAEQDLSLCHNIQTGFGAHPASCPVGNGVLFSGVKQLGHEADHSPLPSPEDKNEWSYNCTHTST
jgi:hypothetical protein